MRECNLRLDKLIMVACVCYLEVDDNPVEMIEGGEGNVKDSC
jgi:hypothetical protein